MPSTPWRQVRRPEPARDYLVLLSRLPLTRLSALPRFLLDSRRIEAQLRATPGLVGYGLYAELLALRFWTLSAWEDEAALQAFVSAQPHAAVMDATRGGAMGPTTFVRWRLPGAALPPGWRDAFGRVSGPQGTT